MAPALTDLSCVECACRRIRTTTSLHRVTVTHMRNDLNTEPGPVTMRSAPSVDRNTKSIRRDSTAPMVAVALIALPRLSSRRAGKAPGGGGVSPSPVMSFAAQLIGISCATNALSPPSARAQPR